MSDPLHPSLSLLSKLGSLAVHVDEGLLSLGGHHFDLNALASLLDDAEVKEWLREMQSHAFLPVKR